MNPLWKCQVCGETGTGFPEDPECPTCSCEVRLLEDGVRQAAQLHELLLRRAHSVARLLDFGHDEVRFNATTFAIEWMERNCSRGCCGSTQRCEDVPLRYLWMGDEEIAAEVDGKKAEEARVAAATEKAKALASAEAELQRALEKAATAQRDAEGVAVQAAAKLAALRGV